MLLFLYLLFFLSYPFQLLQVPLPPASAPHHSRLQSVDVLWNHRPDKAAHLPDSKQVSPPVHSGTCDTSFHIPPRHFHNSSVPCLLPSLLFRSLLLILLFSLPDGQALRNGVSVLLYVLFDSCIHLCMFLSFHISLEMLMFLFDCFAGFLSSVVWFPID